MNWFPSRLMFVFFPVFCLCVQPAMAQRKSANASQTFSLKVNNMMDIGFENNQNNPNQPQNKLEDIIKGSQATYNFRLRSNEHFRLSLNTGSNDSTGINTDSLLQVSVVKGGEEDTAEYKDISNEPQTLFSGNGEKTDQSFTIKYRAKPGVSFPSGLKRLDLLYTASHP